MYGLANYNFTVVEPNDHKVITSGLKIVILSAGDTAATVYADSIKTSKTNPITQTVFDALGSGVVSFWSGASSLDIGVIDQRGFSKIYRGVTTKTHSLVFDASVVEKRLVFEYDNDFSEYNSTFNFAVVEDAGAGGGDVITDAANGVLSVGCDGDDNDECYISSIAEVFKFDTTHRVYFAARVKLTEANTDDANMIIGLSDTVAADSLVDNGAGPMASYDGAVFFKVDGGTVWQFESSNAVTQDTEASEGAFSDGAWQLLEFFYDPADGTTATITPYVDGVAQTAVTLTISGLAEMHILLGVKAGGGNEEDMLVDRVLVRQERQ